MNDDRNNRNYRQLRASFALTVDDVVKALHLVGMTVSADRVRRWGRSSGSGPGRYSQMNDQEFDAFVTGASKWLYDERQAKQSTRIRINEPSDAMDHPAGAWWDTHVGEEFDAIRLIDGVPRQWEVDVSALQERGELTTTSAYVPEAYVSVLGR